jgi:hypothetical protein
MSDTFNERLNKRTQQELDEFHNDPVRLGQAQLDNWWQSQRDLEEEFDDTYTVGGFMERWSQTPSYTKSKRDRDWRIK